jgi:mannose-1-phosphate guanylyltransferase
VSGGRYAVILAGGRGERFWPSSTAKKPKQILALVGTRPLVALAAERLRGVVPAGNVYLVTNADLAPAVRSAVRGLVPAANVIGEPVGRDTGAAVALGAALVKARDPAGVFAVLPADHLIRDGKRFRATLSECFREAASRDVLVTIGIQPTGPATGYGYIRAGPALKGRGRIRLHRAQRFVEKPVLAVARRYLASGRYFWNSGLFVWSVPVLEKALRRHAPGLARLLDHVSPAIGGSGFARVLRRAYARLERISIDYALMEKAGNVVMARGDFDWDDLGSWSALGRHVGVDSAGNAVLGRLVALDARDNIVVSGGRVAALLGVTGLVVVATPKAVLVCARERAEDVKALVRHLARAGRYGGVL